MISQLGLGLSFANPSDKSKVGRFKLDCILEAQLGSIVEPDHLTTRSYYAFYEHSFLVLPDQKTVVGVEFTGNRNTILMEDITKQWDHTKMIGTYGHYIYTMTFLPESRTLLVGDHIGNVYQISRPHNSWGWKLEKSYTNLGIGLIYSSTRLGHLVVFGGYNFGIRVVDTARKQIFSTTFKTALCYNYSLRFWVRSRCQVLLLVSGQTGVYSDSQSDVLDATGLFRHFGISLEQCGEESGSEGETQSEKAGEAGEGRGGHCSPKREKSHCRFEEFSRRFFEKFDEQMERLLKAVDSRVAHCQPGRSNLAVSDSTPKQRTPPPEREIRVCEGTAANRQKHKTRVCG